MSGSERDWFKAYAGKTFEEATRTPSASSSIDRYLKSSFSKFDLIPLGWSAEGQAMLSQEDRANHMHILGATQEGKSKLIELLIRDDIKNGHGACLLDPSLRGSTVNKVLSYCASVGFEKVCLIEPADFLKSNRIPTLKPFKYEAPAAVSVGNLMDSMQVIWGTKDYTNTPRIQKFLPAVLYGLMASRLQLSDIRYLLSRTEYYPERDAILNHPDFDRSQAGFLKDAYRNPATFEQFQSTVNRVNVFSDHLLQYVFGSDSDGIPWTKLITDGWLILVNLFPRDVWGDSHLQQRVLGTFIISEIVHAINRLENRGWRGSHYLYIDEAGMYATRKLADILDYHGKTALRLILAHQRFSQFEDESILQSVRQNAKNKVLFYSPNRLDRETMMRDMGYGGDLPDRQVSHILAQLEKGQAAVAIGKTNPRIVRISRIDDVQVPQAQLIAFKEKLYQQEGFYPKEQIENEIDARLRTTPTPAPGGGFDPDRNHTKGSRKRSVRDSKTARPADASKPKRKTYFDS